MITTAKAQMISDGRIAIPEDCVNSLGLDDGASVDLSLSGDKIIMKKARHPLEDMCSLLDDVEFTDSDHKQERSRCFLSEVWKLGGPTAEYGCQEDNFVVTRFEV